MLCLVEYIAHTDAQQGQKHCQNGKAPNIGQGDGGGSFQQDALGMDAKKRTDLAGGESGDITGQQRGGEEGAHGFKFHAEERCGQRCAEQTGKHGAHAAHDHDLAVIGGELKEPSQQGCGAAAQLQCRAFPTGTATEEMGDGGGGKDHRCDLRLQRRAAECRFNDFVGAAIASQAGNAVDAYAAETCQRQQPNEPAVFLPHMGDKMQRMVESCAEQTADDAHQHAENAPFEK